MVKQSPGKIKAVHAKPSLGHEQHMSGADAGSSGSSSGRIDGVGKHRPRPESTVSDLPSGLLHGVNQLVPQPYTELSGLANGELDDMALHRPEPDTDQFGLASGQLSAQEQVCADELHCKRLAAKVLKRASPLRAPAQAALHYQTGKTLVNTPDVLLMLLHLGRAL